MFVVMGSGNCNPKVCGSTHTRSVELVEAGRPVTRLKTYWLGRSAESLDVQGRQRCLRILEKGGLIERWQAAACPK